MSSIVNETALKGLDLESRQMILDTIGLMRERILTTENILKYDQEEIFPEEVIREMLGPEIGLQLLFIPEEYGGIGGGTRDVCAAVQEVCKICLGVGTAFFAIHLGADPLLAGGTDAQQAKWLGKIAEEGSLVGYAVTEDGAGSNLAALKSTADPIMGDDGNITGYKINGTKQFISNGGYADFVTVLANTPEGPSFFVVEKGTPGFDQGKSEVKHGIRASNTSPLSFTDVVVPAENLIGDVPGEGMKQASKVFGYTRLMVAAMSLGPHEAALEIMVPYAKERIQFGSPLSEKQGYTHKLVVPNAVRFEAGKAYVDAIALRLDSGESDLLVEGSISKLFTSEAANTATDDAIQGLGGYGYITEYEIEKIKRDVRITRIYEGTSEIQQTIISTMRWKTTRKTKGEFYSSLAAEMRELDKEVNDAGINYYGTAADVLNQTMILANDHRLVRQQHIMFLLADMITHIEVGATLARKVSSAVKAGSSDADYLKTVSRVFANEVARIVSDNCSTILLGSGVYDQAALKEFAHKTGLNELTLSGLNIIRDMDLVADSIFKE